MLETLKSKLAATAKTSSKNVMTFLEESNIKVSDEEQKKRFSICETCEEFHQKTKFCRTCGCYMPVKTWIASVNCPLKKWVKIENATK